MNPFTFQTTPKIILEPGAGDKLGEYIQKAGASRLMLITDSGLVQTGIVDRIRHGLEKAGYKIFVFDRVVADPPETMVIEAVTEAKANQAGAIVGLGGGSSLDTAKLVAFLSRSQQDLADIVGIDQAEGDRRPLFLLPTTAGTGSEVTPIAIVTTLDQQKTGVIAPQLLPDMAILDPELTLGLPPAVTAATGIDAMVHAIEAYTTKIKKNPISDVLAQKSLAVLSNNIQRAVENGQDIQSRSEMLLGSMLAGQAFANAPVAAVHALAYPLGGRFHLSHGLSNSLMLAPVMRFNAEVVAGQYAELAGCIIPEQAEGDPFIVSNRLIDWIEGLIRKIGLENQLRQVGVGGDDLEQLAADAVKQERLLMNNPRTVTYEDALAIYKAAF